MSLKFTFLLLTVSSILSGLISANTDSVINNTPAHIPQYSLIDIKSGERIFYGLISTGTKTVNCASCHNTNYIDTFNWNPSALDIAAKCGNLDSGAFKSLIMQPSGNLMTALHDSLKLTDLQIHQLQAFLFDFAKHGGENIKPLKTNRIIFILLILLFCLSIIDLTITKKIRIKLLHIVVILISIYFISEYIVVASIDLGRSRNYHPDQPIKFSHKVHAGQNKTECLYCHYNAQQSKFAGIPPASLCMNCHVIVREGSRSGTFEIAKIYAALDGNKPIQWIKVHNLPDYVFFSHAQHVVVGKIECAKCHGDVANMDQIVQVSDLSMGWCVNCHRETGVQFDNQFYEKYEKLHKDFKEGKIKMVTVEKIGGTDCMRCHY